MSDKNDKNEAPQQPEVESETAESVPETTNESAPHTSESDPVDSTTEPRSGSGGAVAWLALLLALASAGLAGWQWWQSRVDADAALALLEGRVAEIERSGPDAAALESRLSRLESRLQDLASRQEEQAGLDFDPAALSSELETLSGRDDDLGGRIDSLSSRLEETAGRLEARMQDQGEVRADALSESIARARTRLSLMEAAGLLRLGQSRAEQAGDFAAATVAYEQAFERLRTMDDARFERLRGRVARELEALRSVAPPDWSALIGQLVELESGSAQWPLARASGSADHETSEEVGGEESGWWSSVKQSMGSLVRVSPRDAASLAPAAVESVRERVRLHLAAAQAAAARRHGEELSRQISAARELIEVHFDQSATPVASALATLDEAGSAQAATVPELGQALAEIERRLDAS